MKTTAEFTTQTIDQEGQSSVGVAHPQEMGRHAVGEVLKTDPSYKFVFCLHAPENSHAIAEALQDCDVLAFEATGGSPEERLNRETIYTGLLSSRLPEDARQEVLEALMKGDENDAFMAGILKDLAMTDKRVVLVDIEENSPNYHLLKKMEATDYKYRTAIAKNALNDELKILLVENIKAWADASHTRENLVVSQLEEVQEQEATKVGVVMGAVHTPVQHELARSGYDTDRVFVDTNSKGNIGEKAHYSYLNQAMRQLRLQPDSQLESSFVDRTLLSDMYYTYAFSQEDKDKDGQSVGYIQEHMSEKIQTEVIEAMSDVEVSNFLQKIDDLKRASRGRFINKKNSKVQYQVKKLLDENQQAVRAK